MGAFGKVDKEDAVQKLLWATLDDEKLVKYTLPLKEKVKNGILIYYSVTCCT